MGTASFVLLQINYMGTLIHMIWLDKCALIINLYDKKCNRVSCSSYCRGFRCLNTYIGHSRPCDRSKWICYNYNYSYYHYKKMHLRRPNWRLKKILVVESIGFGN